MDFIWFLQNSDVEDRLHMTSQKREVVTQSNCGKFGKKRNPALSAGVSGSRRVLQETATHIGKSCGSHVRSSTPDIFGKAQTVG
jgi:hypothetical protein